MSRKLWIVAAGCLALLIAGIYWVTRPEPPPPGETVTLLDPPAQYVDPGELLHLTETLSSDALQGRRIGTPGNEAARGFLRKRFETLNLKKIGDSYEHPFTVDPPDGAPADAPTHGTNLIGLIEGKTPGQGKMIVITAHFDHLGVIDGEIYNGADDNASGSAALVAAATWFTAHKPEHDLLFALVDGEEEGFLGSRALVQSGLVDMSRVALDINFDMVGRSDTNELYVSGLYHTPGLKPLVDEIVSQAEVNLLTGHDRPEQGHDDWTLQSDHAAFYEAGIPFLYFGVEDHPDYHKPTDDFGRIPPAFFVHSADTLVMSVIEADKKLDSLDLSASAPGAAQPSKDTP